ncbi:hypothetical protein BU607_00670 [Staphylococcus auricularis]|uniref:Uncharacterized protein n=1 Tax=Staphylococcus auricularis TaxID=29379 RepID=A0ABX5IH31_9STAP|nr:hypothetical protein BU607_00670 [Staphylococcus auricularis]PTH26573.1 hypothetical protein BU608_04125 [Staphylococcus auricularis]
MVLYSFLTFTPLFPIYLQYDKNESITQLLSLNILNFCLNRISMRILRDENHKDNTVSYYNCITNHRTCNFIK